MPSRPSPWTRPPKVVPFRSRFRFGRVGKGTIALALAFVIVPPAGVLVWKSLEASPARMIKGGSLDAFDGRSAVIIDGDTIALGSERVRILNIDAPESYKPNCERELIAGLKAKERLAQLVRSGPLSVDRQGQDRYRRTLATVSASGRDVGAVLIAEGFALPWQDGAAAKQARIRHWCG